MGGDGGVVATNRTYMRGAGSACHTADSKRASASAKAEAERNSIIETMKTCAITGNKLNYKEEIVACPYGKLYGKEAAVKALLRRIEEGKNSRSRSGDDGRHQQDLGWHVRGLKDLKPVRFQVKDEDQTTTSSTKKNNAVHQFPICPITSIELNGLQPAFLIVKKKQKKKKKSKNKDAEEQDSDENHPNVLSEKAIKTMGMDAMQEEYGPFEQDDLIRLAPPGHIMDGIKLKLEEKRMKADGKSSSKKQKRKQIKNGDEQKDYTEISNKKFKKSSTIASEVQTNPNNCKTVDDVRSDVAAVVASSSALSSLFSDKHAHLTDKQKKDKLFSCNC